MRSISERDLAVVIPLLALKIRDLERERRELESRERTQAEAESLMQTQELLAQYEGVLDTLRAEYEEGLAEGINLPSYDDLTRGILGSQA